jgi:hypothetical protein
LVRKLFRAGIRHLDRPAHPNHRATLVIAHLELSPSPWLQRRSCPPGIRMLDDCVCVSGTGNAKIRGPFSTAEAIGTAEEKGAPFGSRDGDDRER